MENKVLSYERRFQAMRDRGNKFVEEYGITISSKYHVPASKSQINLITSLDMQQLLAIGREIDSIIAEFEKIKKKAEEAGLMQTTGDDYYFPLGRD